MRLGFFLGFLIGSGLAVLLTRPESVEAPAAVDGASAGPTGAGGVLARVKARAREAMAAGRQAADETESEMERRFEESKHQHG